MLAITNIMGSQATRDAEALFMRARARDRRRRGEDIRPTGRRDVLLALRLAELRGTLSRERLTELSKAAQELDRPC